jgi:hypothetical protein
MARKISAVIIGLIASLMVVGIFSPAIPTILPSISTFVGGLIAGIIVRKQGALYGGIVALAIFVLLIISLLLISHQYSGNYELHDIENGIPNVIAILFGAAGGYLGSRLISYRNSRKEQEKTI